MSRILRRAAWALAALWLVASLAFAMIHLAPGGPAVALAGDYGAPGYLEEVARAHGLDRPLLVQYRDFLGRLLTGDLGQSYRAQRPVAALIAERLPVSLALVLPSILLSALLGIGLGLAAARLGAGGGALFAGAMAGLHAVPGIVVAQGLVLVFAVGLGWLPVQGLGDPRVEPSLAGWLRHLALPVAALTLHQISFMALIARARLVEEMARPYAATARAKGLAVAAVRRRHALPNALLPLLTLSGTRLAGLIGGAVVVEMVFALPGLGRLAVGAAVARDHPVVIGTVLVACAAVIVANALVDGLAALIDPRLGEDAAL